MNTNRNIGIALIIAVVVVAIIVFLPRKMANPNEVATGTPATLVENTPATGETAVLPVTAPTPQSPRSAQEPVLPPSVAGKTYKDLVRPTGFSNTNTLNLLNTNEFTLKQFVGQRVILLNFWTSSASNALRVFPHLNQWHTKYKDKGLLVVSVHVPRFIFEQSKDIVDKTAFAYGVTHPIVLDNNYGTWNAYGNTVWPHQYLIDINGVISYDHPGEGAYEATEAKIQSLLRARTQKLGLPAETYAPYSAPKDAVAIDLARLKSPETYFGTARNNSLGNAKSAVDGPQDLAYPSGILPNLPYFSGSWSFAKEYAMNLTAGGLLKYAYNAKGVQGVMGSEKLTRINVTRDGLPVPVSAAGKDLRFEKGVSYFYVHETRIYDIIADQNYGAYTFEFTIEQSGLKIYTLAFN